MFGSKLRRGVLSGHPLPIVDTSPRPLRPRALDAAPPVAGLHLLTSRLHI